MLDLRKTTITVNLKTSLDKSSLYGIYSILNMTMSVATLVFHVIYVDTH